MFKKLAAVLVLSILVGCSGTPLSLLTGGGPNVAANTQVGQENSQTVGQSNSQEFKIIRPQARDINQISEKSEIKSDEIGTVINNEFPTWFILLFGLLCGFLIPSPSEIGRRIMGLFRRD